MVGTDAFKAMNAKVDATKENVEKFKELDHQHRCGRIQGAELRRWPWYRLVTSPKFVVRCILHTSSLIPETFL